jgi:hypothetical protein
MAYETHITRAHHWKHSEERPIEAAEWAAYIASDSEMELAEYAIVSMADGTTIRMEGPGIAVWTGYSGAAEAGDRDDADGSGVAGNRVWFQWLGAEIVVRNADEEIRRKMHDVALALSAYVQGDDDEFYGPDGRESASAAPPPRRGGAASKSGAGWFKKLFGS